MECTAFIEANYPKLMKYALKWEKGDEDKAHDLLHSTIIILLEGRWNMDFKQAPLHYFYQMLRRQKNYKQEPKQKGFENGFVFEESEVEGMPIQDGGAHDAWMAMEREDNHYDELVANFDELTISLTPLQRTYIEGSLDGLSYEGMAHLHGTTVDSVKQGLVKARKKIKEKALQIRPQASQIGAQG